MDDKHHMTDYAADTAVMNTYGRAEIAFVRGNGCWLESESHERYLDCASGIAVNTLGHAHPRLVAALQDQAGKLWHTSNLYRIPGQEQVAKRLASLSGLDQVFFCNSGAEATEAAVKIARRAAYEKGMADRTTILCASGAFHGRTLGMLAATDRPAFRTGFGPMPAGFAHVPFGNMNALRAAMGPHVAAVMIESVQGEGGAKQVPDNYLADARAAADEFGALLIADEVQAGIGRTGHLFSFEPSGIKPDIVALAKGLAGGFPVGAVIASAAVGSAMTPGTHGSTFGGNPLACVASLETIKIIEDEKLLDNAKIQGEKIINQLTSEYKGNSKIKEIRGTGLMIGIEFHENCSNLNKIALENNVILNITSNNTLRLLPPLIINNQESDFLVDKIIKIINKH